MDSEQEAEKNVEVNVNKAKLVLNEMRDFLV